MIIPAWLTLHVVGYGLASGVILGAGAYALSQHDGRIRAEDKAQAAIDRDTLRTRLMQDAIDRAAAKIDTVIVATKSIIQPTKIFIDSAAKHITDTVLVRAALAKADSTVKACTELLQTCGDFKKMATDSMRVLGILLRQSDQRALKVFAPQAERRFSWGIQAGTGVCLAATKPIGGQPCLALTFGGHLRIF